MSTEITKKIFLSLGESKNLYSEITPNAVSASKVSWSTTNSSVATVTGSLNKYVNQSIGTVQAIAHGKATIKASVPKYIPGVHLTVAEVTDTCEVTVLPKNVKIYLSPENVEKWKDMPGFGFYGNERTQMKALANKVYQYLSNHGCDVTLGYNTEASNTPAEYAIPRKDESNIMYDSNPNGINLHVCIHSNGLDGTAIGPRVFYLNNDTKGAKFAQIVYDELFNLYKKSFPNAIKTDTKNSGNDYVELRETKATAILVETAFHDNVNDAHWIIDKMDSIAETISEGIIGYLCSL